MCHWVNLSYLKLDNSGFIKQSDAIWSLQYSSNLQRLMERHMGKLNLRDCLIYWDDIIAFSSTFEEHDEQLQVIFSSLGLHNLQLKANKCEFFKSQVIYIVHIDSEEGIQADQAKIETAQNLRILSR